jgi:hypothetical protein
MFAVGSDVSGMNFDIINTVNMVNHLLLKIKLDVIEAALAVNRSITVDCKIHAIC